MSDVGLLDSAAFGKGHGRRMVDIEGIRGVGRYGAYCGIDLLLWEEWTVT